MKKRACGLLLLAMVSGCRRQGAATASTSPTPTEVAVVTTELARPTEVPPARCPRCNTEDPWPTDLLPEVTGIAFAGSSAGFVLKDGRRYAIDRATLTAHALGEKEFESRFKVPKPVPEGEEIFASSAGERYQVVGWPHKGETQLLKTRAGKIITTHVPRDEGITAVEAFPDQLWIASSVAEGGGGDSAPVIVGIGVHVESLVGLPAGLLLSGLRVSQLRVDPRTGEVWAISPDGVRIVRPDGTVRETRYFSEAFAPDTGKPELALTVTARETDPLVIFARHARIRDAKGFATTAGSLSFEQHCAFQWCSFDPPGKEANVLVPFVIASIDPEPDDAQHDALMKLCRFDDERALRFLATFDQDPGVAQCLDRRSKNPLTDERADSDLARLDAALLVQPVKKNDSDAAAMAALEALWRLHDARGTEHLARYFSESKWEASDQVFLDVLMASYHERPEIEPIALLGLQHAEKAQLTRACRYFNPAEEGPWKGRRDVTVARYLVEAKERLSRDSLQNDLGDGIQCSNAAREQLADAPTREAFQRDVFPKLTPAAQRAATDAMK